MSPPEISGGEKSRCTIILNALEFAMRQANNLPSTNDLDILELTSPNVKATQHNLKKRLVAIIASVASRYAVTNRPTDSDSVSSHSAASVTPRDHLYDETVETTEEALESFNTTMDAARGIQDAIVYPRSPLGPDPRPLKVGLGFLGKRLGGFLDIEKPQIHFPDYPINNSDKPFIPPYNSISGNSELTLNDPKTEYVDRHLQELFRNNSSSDGERRHPYEDEIAAAVSEMSKKIFEDENTIVYSALDETQCMLIATEEDLFNAAERLKCVSEIAVDLENHSMRSFQGFTCLLQISTRREDFVIDTLKLRASINRALAPIFADDGIVKVLHGADQDVQWLERDFGIYVVNMFDTGQAARLLKLPSAALSFLLAKYCNVSNTSKKKFQLADWRQRPLPKEMYEYARSDTHYLLYVYDRLRSELSKNDLLTEAWERSAKISRKRHSKPRYDPYMARTLAAKHGLGFDGHQIRLLEALSKWRDTTAREEDESLTYVAPIHILFGIVRARDDARTVPSLMKHGFPKRQVPPLVYKHAEAITRLVSDALDAKLDEGVCSEQTAAKSNDEAEIRKQVGSAEEIIGGNAAGNVTSNLIAEEGSNCVGKQCTEEERNHNPESSVLPVPKLRTLSSCDFFASESESASDSERISCPKNPAVQHDRNAAGLTVRDDNVMGNDRRATEGDKVGGEVRGEEIGGKSIFALSDSSDESEVREGKGKGKFKAGQIAEELAAELAEKARALKTEEFETELDARKREYEERLQRERCVEEERENEEREEEEDISILELARPKDADKKHGRKRKREKALVEETKRLEAFDYSKALMEMESKRERKREEKSFDPMEGLKSRRSMVGRSKAKRRRRGRGKSMSFSSRA